MHRALLATLVVTVLVSPLCAQYTPPPPPLTTGPCKPTKEYPCAPLPDTTTNSAPAATKFPFPDDPPAGAAKPAPAQQFPFPDDPPSKPAEAAPAASSQPASSQPTAGQKFPFPDDAPTNAGPASSSPADPAHPAPAQRFPFPDDASSSSSSSSSSGDPADAIPDADKPALADKGSYGSTRASRRRKLAVPEDLDAREAQDLEVSHYYATTGNFKGSYMRAQDAVKTIPDDPMAHFALAESARNMKLTDEAIAEYKAYLRLDPEGEKVKAAKQALAELVVK